MASAVWNGYIYIEKKQKGVPRVHAHATQGRIEGAQNRSRPREPEQTCLFNPKICHNDKVFDKQYRGTKVAQAGGFVVSF